MGEVVRRIINDPNWEHILHVWGEFFPVRQVQAPTLSHYTNTDGLLGICRSNTIWATCSEYCNDASEGVYALSLARVGLDQFFQNRELTQNGRDLRSHLEGYLSPAATREDVYVASFCESSDLLSQWRAYGKDAGFEVRFVGLSRPNPLLRGVHSLTLSAHSVSRQFLERIEYDHDAQLATLNIMLGRIYAVLERLEQRGHIEDVVTILASYSLLELVRWQCTVKHPAFCEEREWRIVAFPNIRVAGGAIEYVDFSSIRYRAGRHSVIPYLEFSPPAETKLPITEIICGPGGHQVLTAKAVRLLLRTSGFDNVTVRNSSVPLVP